jgi:hypothetical protein
LFAESSGRRKSGKKKPKRMLKRSFGSRSLPRPRQQSKR